MMLIRPHQRPPDRGSCDYGLKFVPTPRAARSSAARTARSYIYERTSHNWNVRNSWRTSTPGAERRAKIRRPSASTRPRYNASRIGSWHGARRGDQLIIRRPQIPRWSSSARPPLQAAARAALGLARCWRARVGILIGPYPIRRGVDDRSFGAQRRRVRERHARRDRPRPSASRDAAVPCSLSCRRPNENARNEPACAYVQRPCRFVLPPPSRVNRPDDHDDQEHHDAHSHGDEARADRPRSITTRLLRLLG